MSLTAYLRAEIGQNVETKFKAFAKSIMTFEKRCFSQWSESINSIAMSHLKHAIFKKNPETGGLGPWSGKQCCHVCTFL